MVSFVNPIVIHEKIYKNFETKRIKIDRLQRCRRLTAVSSPQSILFSGAMIAESDIIQRCRIKWGLLLDIIVGEGSRVKPRFRV